MWKKFCAALLLMLLLPACALAEVVISEIMTSNLEVVSCPSYHKGNALSIRLQLISPHPPALRTAPDAATRPVDSKVATHPVRVDAQSRFAHIIGAESLMTNSHHHQAVKQLAPVRALRRQILNQ